MTGSTPRASGILLHITSLPGPYGIGDFGEAARRFVDLLAQAGQRYWQVLPLNPTGFVDSPYQALSSFAGNTNLISLDALIEPGWLTQADLADRPPFRARRVDYELVIPWHDEMLSLAYERFTLRASSPHRDAFAAWCTRESHWLDDYALFIALKERNGLRAWVEWPDGEAAYGRTAIAAARKTLRHRIDEHRFRQWLFFTQWLELKGYANTRGIHIIGDIPFYVGHDCCDVWLNPALFDLDVNGQPRFIAGVPPDSFSATGQRWGNPLYIWERHAADGYAWWKARIDAALGLYDQVRIDHFRAFDRYWRIPGGDPTAERGKWMPGPGAAFFEALGPERRARIIAEDLGDDIADAIRLRKQFGLPGMAVVQFAFSGQPAEQQRFAPDIADTDLVVYTGTHDNHTALSWWQLESTDEQRQALIRAVQNFAGQIDVYSEHEPHWAMIGLGMSYRAHTFIAPMQDVLGVGERGRMNRPAVPSGNWRWRCTAEDLHDADWARLRDLAVRNGRAAPAPS